MPSIPSKPLDIGPLNTGLVSPPARIDSAQSSPPADPGQCGPPPDEAGLQLSTELGALGKAQTSLALDGDAASQAWKQAAKGPKLELHPKPGTRLAYLSALIDHLNESKGLSEAQKSRIKGFLKEFPAEFAPKQPQAQSRAIKLLNELLEAGISQPQLGLIGDGKFTAADLARLLRDNPGPSLVGWNPGDSSNTKPVGLKTDGQHLQQMHFGGAAGQLPRAAFDSTTKPAPEQPKAPHPRETRPPSPDG